MIRGYVGPHTKMASSSKARLYLIGLSYQSNPALQFPLVFSALGCISFAQRMGPIAFKTCKASPLVGSVDPLWNLQNSLQICISVFRKENPNLRGESTRSSFTSREHIKKLLNECIAPLCVGIFKSSTHGSDASIL